MSHGGFYLLDSQACRGNEVQNSSAHEGLFGSTAEKWVAPGCHTLRVRRSQWPHDSYFLGRFFPVGDPFEAKFKIIPRKREQISEIFEILDVDRTFDLV
jgi:hypothetical protein